MVKKPTPRAENAKYLKWIRQLPCVVTGKVGVEAAHLSTGDRFYGHAGRGMSRKASDRWALPLCPEEHRKQHDGNELDYWRDTGINPYWIALILWGIYCDNLPDPDKGTEDAETVIKYATMVCAGGLKS
jgi:hypothetical protein